MRALGLRSLARSLSFLHFFLNVPQRYVLKATQGQDAGISIKRPYERPRPLPSTRALFPKSALVG